MELAVVKYIKKYGLKKTLNDFKLKSKDYGDRIILKYDQINSNMDHEEVCDSRGLILEVGTWKVISLAFRKFFNSAEGRAATIDWNTAHVLEKLDGSCLQIYNYKDKWYAGTTGTADGEGEVNNKNGTTFSDLFWSTALKCGLNVDNLIKGYTYVFELTTPYNIVVKPHATSSITLLAVRDVTTLDEVQYSELLDIGINLNIPVVKSFDLNKGNVGVLLRTFEGMPWLNEGYVVVDSKFNRIKIKNPAYVAVHHLKSKTSEHAIMEVVKSNEIDEFVSTFPERADEITKLHINYNKLVDDLTIVWDNLKVLKPKNITPGEKKRFASEVFKSIENTEFKSFSGLFFGLENGRVKSVEEYILEFDNKKLYQIL
jgi:hypothetical protein